MSAPVIDLAGLTKLYGPTIGIKDLTLAIGPGEVFGFLGPNGAGKTTTIRLLLDLIRPTGGTARLFGLPPGDSAARARTGYLPGDLRLDPRLTAEQTMDFFARLRTTHRAPSRPSRREEICTRLGLGRVDRRKLVRDLSRGTLQKLGLVLAFQHDPDLLVLDEPTTSLDPLVRGALFEMIAEAGRAGRTVFHSSHVLAEVDRTCTRVGMVRQGALLRVDRVDALRQSSARRVEVLFAGEIPREDLARAGAVLVEAEGRRALLRVAGSIQPLVEVLARHPVESLVMPEPGLEETFLHLYRPESTGGTEP